MKKLLLIFAFVPFLLFAQTRKQRKALEAQRKADQQVITNLKNHIGFFESKNSQQFPDASINNEWAMEYISNQFKAIGLQPKGTNGYLHQFKVDEGKQIEPATFLKVNGTLLVVKKDYIPLSFSAAKSVTGMPAMALREKGVPWFTDIKDFSGENTKNDFDITDTIKKEADRAASKGATALFLYNSSNAASNLRFNSRDKTPSSPIPVIYITPAAYNKYFTDPSQVLDIELNVAFKESIKNANNIIGYIDNGAASNIIIAAPYNRVRPEESENAPGNGKNNGTGNVISGASMLIELARMLMTSKAKNNNYTFIAYSGEDTLSQDSKWLNNSAITARTNYIINLDKVDRYDEDKKLSIEGYGTSPEWIETIKPLADKTLEVSFDSSNFKARNTFAYQVKVPVLNFLTSSHKKDSRDSAYHDKINYEGELQIARFIYRLIEATDGKGKLAFTENNEPPIRGPKTGFPGISAQKNSPPLK